MKRRLQIAFLGLLVLGCAKQPGNDFLKWELVGDLSAESGQLAISEILANKEIATVCQLSPYTSRLKDSDTVRTSALIENELLPVGEGYYLFAYFGEAEEYLGSDQISSNLGRIRAADIASESYVCQPVDSGQLTVKKSAEFTEVGLVVDAGLLRQRG